MPEPDPRIPSSIPVLRVRGRVEEITRAGFDAYDPCAYIDIFCGRYRVVILGHTVPQGHFAFTLLKAEPLPIPEVDHRWVVVMDECPYVVGQTVEIGLIRTWQQGAFQPASNLCRRRS